MGQTLSEPITDKETSEGGDERLFYAASSMQGWRLQMEDAHTTILNLLREDPELKAKYFDGIDAASIPPIAFFGVYDGHGGSSVAKYSGREVHRKIAAEPSFKAKEYRVAIKNGFLAADEALKTDPEYLRDPAGCTAVTVLVTDDWKVFCGNAGDSRAIMSSNGIAIPLSFDHKPGNADETARIRNAGGFVEFGRVNGNLALSRAIGDFEFKQNSTLPPEQQVVTVNPDIEERQLDLEKDEFIVLACDGIWDCMSNEEVVYYVRSEIAENNKTLPQIAESIMDRCLASDSDLGGYGCDNMTVVIVALLGGAGKTKEAWYETVRSRFLEEKRNGAPAEDESGDESDEAEETKGTKV
ncbi:phosphatase 2C-like domain-containing protein [Zopfochytrium polystomum]|nr:phosphatase 2C-like domain-containing protein [Zopfochytrium polystomum]